MIVVARRDIRTRTAMRGAGSRERLRRARGRRLAKSHWRLSCRRRRTGRPSGRENARRVGDPSRTAPTLVRPQRKSCWEWQVGAKREPAEMWTTSR
jgi:hypothetical protein